LDVHVYPGEKISAKKKKRLVDMYAFSTPNTTPICRRGAKPIHLSRTPRKRIRNRIALADRPTAAHT